MVVPEAIERLDARGTHASRRAGLPLRLRRRPFYWQYHFIVPLGIPNPIAPAAFDESGFRAMNTMCFEGGLFARSVVDEIGFPDPRFFIYWDDTVYGYLASKVTESIVVSDIILQRSRDIPNWDIAGRPPAQRNIGHEPLPHHA